MQPPCWLDQNRGPLRDVDGSTLSKSGNDVCHHDSPSSNPLHRNTRSVYWRQVLRFGGAGCSGGGSSYGAGALIFPKSRSCRGWCRRNCGGEHAQQRLASGKDLDVARQTSFRTGLGLAGRKLGRKWPQDRRFQRLGDRRYVSL